MKAEKMKLGLIGLGQRGSALLNDIFIPSERVEVAAICDIYQDRIDAVVQKVTQAGQKAPFTTQNYKELVDKDKVDLVVVASPWKEHIPMVLYALEKGVPCGSEVGGAESLEECFSLVDTWEKTRTPYMFLENCCYGRREMMVLNMVKKGVFGEIVHCAGGYRHDLRNEVGYGRENRHYRLDEYLTRNCENYPTHELGPIAQVLDINRGNRFLSLTATASKAAGMHDYILRHKPEDEALKNAVFAQGDVVTTVIKCARGETVTLTLDTTLPRFYSRDFRVQGTKGLYEEATDSIYLDGMGEHWNWKPNWGNADTFTADYEHEVWKKYIAEGIQGGHDGMDYLVYNEFFDCVRENRAVPIDVYDAAAWMSITPLSEKSIAGGSVPVEVPDFCKNRR